MSYRDLRGWIDAVDEFGELKRINGADWNLEMGAITEVFARKEPHPAILFDEIKDYPAGASPARRCPSSIAQETMPHHALAPGVRSQAVHHRMERAIA